MFNHSPVNQPTGHPTQLFNCIDVWTKGPTPSNESMHFYIIFIIVRFGHSFHDFIAHIRDVYPL